MPEARFRASAPPPGGSFSRQRYVVGTGILPVAGTISGDALGGGVMILGHLLRLAHAYPWPGASGHRS